MPDMSWGPMAAELYLTHLNPFFIDEVAVSGCEIAAVPSIKLLNPVLLDVSPDGSSLLVQSTTAARIFSPPLYAVEVVGGAYRYLADAADATWLWHYTER